MSSQEVFIFGASFAQQRLWFFDQLLPGNAIYSVPTVIRLHGSLHVGALEFALNEIVRRHETLRTTFTILSEQLVQVIAPSFLISINTLDLRELSTSEREAQAKSIITQEIERPFDLSSEPLLRVILLKVLENEHILLLNMHHIVCDDWSIGVLISELGALYTAKVKNQPSPLSELPLQYADFAEWQREWLTGEVLEKQLAYWRHQLNGITVLPLPTDKRRPNIQSHHGATQFLELPLSLASALEKLSGQEGATLYMTLLAAFQTLLYRYTYSDDIVVGSPIANRNRSEIEGLIGFFVNTLVLRTDFSGNPTFREILSRVREVTLGAYSHQDLPFEKLVEHLQPERNLSASPLFQVVFGFENAPMQELELPDLAPSFMNIDLKTTRFDLELHLWKCSSDFRSLWGGDWQYSEGIRGIVVYNTDLFEDATISRMLKHFTTLLEGIVAEREQRIVNFPLLSEAELDQILFEWNDTQNDYPSNQSIHELFEQQVTQHANNIALNYDNVVETRLIASLQYNELNNRSNQIAHHLQKLGVNTEVVVGICAERSIDMIVGMLGILKAGGAYLPLDPTYPTERLNFMLKDSHAHVLLTQEKFAQHFEDFSNPIVDLNKDWKGAHESKQNLSSETTSDNLACIIYTSGSTGTPKGVAVTHKAVNRLVCNTNYIKITPDDKIAQVSNTSFDAATFEIWGALLNGAQLIGISQDIVLSPNEFASQLKQKDINILFLTTALFQKIARDVPQAFSNLKYLLFGGETIDTRWVKKVLECNRSGEAPQLIHLYGPTENTTFSSYYPIHELPSGTSIPIGRPISNSQIYILDANLQPVPIGVTGEIYVGGDGLARGYINNPELTDILWSNILWSGHPCPPYINTRQSDGRGRPFHKSPSHNTIYKTGDLGRYLPDGNIEFLGRIDNQVKIRGFRIELEEIETLLNQHPTVREAVVIVIEDIPGDKYLVAYIVPQPQQQITTNNLRAFLKQKLPEYMIPVAYVILESLPLTPAGKVNRHALPKIDTLNLNVEENYVAPQTDVEQVLVEIWANILTMRKQPIGVHDNFFELGGHSLLATQLTSRIRDVFHIDLPLRSLFETPTIASLAKYIQMRISTGLNTTSSFNTNIEQEEVEF
ncbi:amino acid adenylation domain-containing protein [Calothrix sp. NIES-4071]|nr:amino acid adenylation domain-containing protein [Calothrix sp. NIES-4071]BAZ60475.1 amino acid adenylation domain-containing protein [Calothrix sp. NIES-4105]